MNHPVRNLPGFIKVVSKGNYVAVVCEREEQAINAARQLKTTWDKPATAPFPTSEDLFNYMRTAMPTSEQTHVTGNPDAAFAGAAKTIEAEYQIPFQGHTAFGRRMPLADPSNGQMTIYSNDMKSYGMRRGIATFLGMPRDRFASSACRARRASAAPRPKMRLRGGLDRATKSAGPFACSG